MFWQDEIMKLFKIQQRTKQEMCLLFNKVEKKKVLFLCNKLDGFWLFKKNAFCWYCPGYK